MHSVKAADFALASRRFVALTLSVLALAGASRVEAQPSNKKIGFSVQVMTQGLTKTTVGNPRNDAVRMGALVSRAQYDSVQEGLALLKTESSMLFDGSAQPLLDADSHSASTAGRGDVTAEKTRRSSIVPVATDDMPVMMSASTPMVTSEGGATVPLLPPGAVPFPSGPGGVTAVQFE